MTEWEQLGIAVTKQACIDYIRCRKRAEKIKAGRAYRLRKSNPDYMLFIYPEETCRSIERFLTGPWFEAISGQYADQGEHVVKWLRMNWRTFSERKLNHVSMSRQ